MDRRSSLSWLTVSPRYSVSSTALELSNCFVSSATVASLVAMALLGLVLMNAGQEMRKAPAHAHGALSPRVRVGNFIHLRGMSLSHLYVDVRARRQPAVLGFVKDTA